MRMSTAVSIGAALRGLAAAAIASASFIWFRQRFYGDCIIPFPRYVYDDTEIYWFLFPLLVFVVGFVWLISEAAFPLMLLSGGRVAPSRAQTVLAGVAVYIAIGASGYLLAPELPGGLVYQEGYREFVWAFWPAGMLVMSGNFSNVECGY